MTFGDWEPDDSFAREPADPEAVARIIHALRVAHALEDRGFDDVDGVSRTVLVAIAAALIERLRREGSL